MRKSDIDTDHGEHFGNVKGRQGSPGVVQPDYEKMLVDVSGQAAGSVDIETFLDRCIGILGRTLPVARIYILQGQADPARTMTQQQWMGDSLPLTSSDLRRHAAILLPWLQRLNARHNIVQYADTAKITNRDVRDLFRNRAVASILLVPVSSEQGLDLVLVFESESSQRPWPMEDINLLRSLAQIISTTLSRIQSRSDQIQNQEKQFQSQKMEALGTMVSGVAHEINNPVNLLMHTVPLIEKVWQDVLPIVAKSSADDPNARFGGLTYSFLEQNFEQLIADVNLAAKRITDIVANLKNFSAQPSLADKKPLQVNKAVSNAMRLAGPSLQKAGIAVDTRLAADLPRVEGISQGIEQVILNLLINAIQSIDHDRGEVRVATNYDPHQRQVAVRVVDNGSGVDPRLHNRIFDPFISTKKNTGGSGLGLAISYRLVKAHNGEVSFENRSEGGTEFKVVLPAHAETQQPLQTPSADTLTGAIHRDQIELRLPLEIKRARRYRQTLSLMLCRVDHFDRLIDVYGYTVADEVLIQVAQTLLVLIRSDVDWLARYDQKTFLIVLPETGLKGAGLLAERLRQCFEQRPLDIRGKSVQLTTSYAVSGIDPLTADAKATSDSMLRTVEKYLISARQQGANRIVSGPLIETRSSG